MKIITEEEKWRVIDRFDNWAHRNEFLEKLIDNQNELIEKVKELENRMEFLEPIKEE